MENSSYNVILVIVSLLMISSPGSSATQASVTISTLCGRNVENCYKNCHTSVKVDDYETARQQKGVMFHIVAIDTYDGKTKNLTINFENDPIPSLILENAKKFLTSINRNSVIIMLSQGCALLPDEVKEIIKPHQVNIEKYKDWNRVNIFVGCKGECPIQSDAFINNEDKFRKTIEIPLKVQRQTTAEPSITEHLPSAVPAGNDQINGKIVMIIGITVGVILSFLGFVLILLCCLKSPPNRTEHSEEHVLKIEEKEKLKNTIVVIRDEGCHDTSFTAH